MTAPSESRIVDLLCDSDGRVAVITGPRNGWVTLCGRGALPVREATLHRMADDGSVVWAGSGVTLPGTDREDRA